MAAEVKVRLLLCCAVWCTVRRALPPSSGGGFAPGYDDPYPWECFCGGCALIKGALLEAGVLAESISVADIYMDSMLAGGASGVDLAEDILKAHKSI